MAYKNIKAMKSSVVEKAQRRLSSNFPDEEYDEDLLEDYFDEAVYLIEDWKRLDDDTKIITGIYDRQIVQYIVESVNLSGLEGQSYNVDNGHTKTFIATPEANLKASIPQSIV